MTWWPWLLIPATYVVASFSPAYWAGRIKGIDLRQHGSKNLGATNAGRVLGRQWFFAVFALDVLKGLLPVLAANAAATHAGFSAEATQVLALAVAIAAVLGHSFTCFHGFKGGKAVATSLGVLIALAPLAALGGFVAWMIVWLIGIAAFRTGAANAVGPASVIAAIAAPITHLVLTERPWQSPALPLTVFITLLGLLVVVRHRKNIAKLFARTPAAGTQP